MIIMLSDYSKIQASLLAYWQAVSSVSVRVLKSIGFGKKVAAPAP